MQTSHSIEGGPAGPAELRFVLVAPSHPGNIGASARALRTMGFARLDVVAPHDPGFRASPEGVALAAGATAVLEGARAFADLPAALADVELAFAMTGYARGFGPRMLDVREAAAMAAQRLTAGGGAAGAPDAAAGAPAPAAAVAFVFGTERTGLENADVERCHYGCAIPADPGYGSLNLAQAVQVVAYECRRALVARRGAAAAAPPRRDATQAAPRAEDVPARAEQTEELFVHLEQALVAVGYLDPAAPRHLMSRLRRLLLRAQPTATEVDILRGICSAMILPRALRAGAKRGRAGE